MTSFRSGTSSQIRLQRYLTINVAFTRMGSAIWPVCNLFLVYEQKLIFRRPKIFSLLTDRGANKKHVMIKRLYVGNRYSDDEIEEQWGKWKVLNNELTVASHLLNYFFARKYYVMRGLRNTPKKQRRKGTKITIVQKRTQMRNEKGFPISLFGRYFKTEWKWPKVFGAKRFRQSNRPFMPAKCILTIAYFSYICFDANRYRYMARHEIEKEVY